MVIIFNYKINERIGKGSFSSVYAAHHIDNKSSTYAIKVIKMKKISEHIREKIEQEVEILSNISHQNIIKLYDSFYYDNILYMVLERCKTDLHTEMTTNKNISSETKIDWIKQLISSLIYLHANKVVHRDLKPQNILLDADNRLKIIDFGFSRYFNPSDMMKTICGSPLYMSPELFINHAYDYKSDYWSMGVIAYLIVVGTLPYNAKNLLELSAKLKNITNIKLPSNIINSYSDDLVHLIESMLITDTKYRLDYDQLLSHPFVIKNKLNMTSDILSDIETNHLPTDSVYVSDTDLEPDSVSDSVSVSVSDSDTRTKSQSQSQSQSQPKFVPDDELDFQIDDIDIIDEDTNQINQINQSNKFNQIQQTKLEDNIIKKIKDEFIISNNSNNSNIDEDYLKHLAKTSDLLTSINLNSSTNLLTSTDSAGYVDCAKVLETEIRSKSKTKSNPIPIPISKSKPIPIPISKSKPIPIPKPQSNPKAISDPQITNLYIAPRTLYENVNNMNLVNIDTSTPEDILFNNTFVYKNYFSAPTINNLNLNSNPNLNPAK